MPKFVIERDMPGVGNLTSKELQAASRNSCGALARLGTDIQWVQSHVTADKIYCVYIAKNEELIQRHANASGIPATRISKVVAIIDPTTSE